MIQFSPSYLSFAILSFLSRGSSSLLAAMSDSAINKEGTMPRRLMMEDGLPYFIKYFQILYSLLELA